MRRERCRLCSTILRSAEISAGGYGAVVVKCMAIVVFCHERNVVEGASLLALCVFWSNFFPRSGGVVRWGPVRRVNLSSGGGFCAG